MKFEVGNKIYCSYHKAPGTITDIKRVDTYPIYVTFEDGNTDTYTKQGKTFRFWKHLFTNIRKGNRFFNFRIRTRARKSVHTILWNSNLKNIRKHSHNIASNI